MSTLLKTNKLEKVTVDKRQLVCVTLTLKKERQRRFYARLCCPGQPIDRRVPFTILQCETHSRPHNQLFSSNVMWEQVNVCARFDHSFLNTRTFVTKSHTHTRHHHITFHHPHTIQSYFSMQVLLLLCVCVCDRHSKSPAIACRPCKVRSIDFPHPLLPR